MRRRLSHVLPVVLAAALALAGALFAASTHGKRTPTASADVLPILLDKCAGCHVQGGIAPFPLTSSRDAVAHAQEIAAAIDGGLMPPWMPGPDSPAYVGQELRRLTAAERSTIDAWAAAGAPLGEDVTGSVRTPATTGAVLTLAETASYLPRASSGATDDYHCFVLDPHLTRDVLVTSARIEPGAASIVHHVILFKESGAAARAALAKDAASGGKGWSCFGGPGLPDAAGGGLLDAPWLAAWVPGKVSTAFPAGTGVALARGSVVVMQVHYNLLHGARPDRSRAVLGIAPATARLAHLKTMLLVAPVELPCAAGAAGPLCSRTLALEEEVRKYGQGEAFTVGGLLYLCGRSVADYAAPADVSRIHTSCDRKVDAPATIYAVAGHMHTRGRDVRLVLDPGTPKERVLLHIPAWDFHWQDAYTLRQPVRVGPGDVLRIECTHDNSSDAQPAVNGVPLPPRYVLWGEGTTDEMCLGIVQYTAG